MAGEVTLILSPHARIYCQDQSVVVDSLDSMHVFSRDASNIMRLLRYEFDGSSTVTEIAKRYAISKRDLVATVASLVDDRVLIDVTTLLESSPAESFLDHFYPLCDEWGRGVFSHPFWTGFMSGELSYNTVIGWGVEFYHRVMGADEHNAIAMHACRDNTITPWLVTHFREEADHGTIFLEGLAAMGLNPLAVEESLALPSTRGLIAYLNALAASNLLAYLGCYAVMHSPRIGQTPERISEQFDRWNSLYPNAVPLFAKIREHAMLDVGLGHDQIVLERVLLQKQKLAAREIRCLLAAAHGITQAFNSFFRGIHQVYGELNAELPVWQNEKPERANAL